MGNTGTTGAPADFVDLIPLTNMWNSQATLLIDSGLSVQGSAVMRGMSFNRVASGKSNTTGESEIGIWTIPLAVAGGGNVAGTTAGNTMVASFQAIQTKIREAIRGSGAYAVNSGVFLWVRLAETGNYVYWPVLAGDHSGNGPKTQLQILFPKRPLSDPIVAAILTLVTTSYGQGDPIVDPVSTVLTPASPSLYRASIPGDVDALTRLWITDLSASGKIAQAMTVWCRNQDGMGANDWTPTYAATPVSPGASHSNANALGGTEARLTTSTSWQTMAGFTAAAGAFQAATDVDVLLKVRDSAAPVTQPTAFTVTAGASASGGLGNATYLVTVVPRDASGNAGVSTGTAAVTINNLIAGGGGTFVLNPIDSDTFTTPNYAGFVSGPQLTVGSGTGGVATLVYDTTSAIDGGTYGLHFHAVGGTTGVSTAAITRLIPPPPTASTSGIYSARVSFVPITISTGNGTSNPNSFGEFIFSGSHGIFWNSTRSKWSLCIGGTDQGAAYDFAMPIAANTLNGTQTIPAGTIALNNASGFASANASAPQYVQITTTAVGVLVQYTGKSGNNLTGCTVVGGTAGSYGSGAAVNQAYIIEFSYVPSNLPNTAADRIYALEVAVNGDKVSGNTAAASTILGTNGFTYMTVQAKPATGNGNSEEFYWGTYACADQYIGVGTSFNGGSITVNATAGSNTSTMDLYYAISGGSIVYRVPAVTFPYVLNQQLPPGVQLVAAVPSGAAPSQPTELRVGYGIAASDLEYSDATSCVIGNSEYEYVQGPTIPWPPSEIPEGMSAFSGVLRLQAKNTGSVSTGGTIDCDEVLLVPHDGDSITVKAPSTLGTAGVWMIDTRRDQRVTLALYQTAAVTAANVVTDATRAANSFNDSIPIPGGFGVYPSGTNLATLGGTGTIGGNPRIQVSSATTYMTATQGWIALSYIPKATQTNRRLFSWSDGTANNIIELYYDGANFVISKTGGGVGGTATVATSIILGGEYELLAYWNATTIGLSVGGSTYTTTANAHVPSGLGSSFDIATRASISNGSTDLYGDVVWFAAGSGAPTQADANIIMTRLATCPVPDDFSAASVVQFIWTCRQITFMQPQILLGSADFAGQLQMGQSSLLTALMQYFDGNGSLIADAANQALTVQPVYRPRFAALRGAT